MQREMIKEKVNRLYGYNAVAKIRFISSGFLGYNRVNRSEFFKRKKQHSIVEKATYEVISKFENIENQELQNRLSIFSENFLSSKKKQV